VIADEAADHVRRRDEYDRAPSVERLILRRCAV
jgi:hypothetical protein